MFYAPYLLKLFFFKCMVQLLKCWYELSLCLLPLPKSHYSRGTNIAKLTVSRKKYARIKNNGL